MENSKINVWDINIPVEKSGYLNNDETQFINYENLKLEPNKLTMIDLFCGAGGFAVGCNWSGFHSVVGIDYLKPAIDTWSLNHPNSLACLGNIKKIDPLIIKEMLARIIDIEAENEEEAIRKARDKYNNQKIILDSGDYIDVEINTYI